MSPRPTASDRLQFPYMFWAHTSSSRTPHVLTQSGMPAPHANFFASLGPLDIGHPTARALPELEDRLAKRFGVDPSRVLVTLGASGGMHLAALRFFRPGVRVLVDVPSYEPFRALPGLLGADLLPIRRRMEHGWQLDPGEVRQSSAGAAGPTHLFLANVHNPTGAMIERDSMGELARAVSPRGGCLISCEVYMEYVPAARRVHAFEVAPNGISIGSLTKAYGLGALRMGWIILGEGLTGERDRLLDLAYLSYVDPPTASLRAASVALEKLPELSLPIERVARESRPLWEKWLRECEEIESFVPPYGIIAFPRVKGIDDTFALAEHLVREHQVDVVPGEFFGLPGHLRIGCGVPPAILAEGLARVTRGIKAWRTLARAASG